MTKKQKKKEQISLSELSEIEMSDTEAKPKELAILNNILTVDAKKNPIEHSKIKFCLYATAIFIVLSLPFTDRLIELAFPMASSWLVLLLIKTIAFFAIIYLLLCLNKN